MNYLFRGKETGKAPKQQKNPYYSLDHMNFISPNNTNSGIEEFRDWMIGRINSQIPQFLNP